MQHSPSYWHAATLLYVHMHPLLCIPDARFPLIHTSVSLEVGMVKLTERRVPALCIMAEVCVGVPTYVCRVFPRFRFTVFTFALVHLVCFDALQLLCWDSALGLPPHPKLYHHATPQRRPWATPQTKRTAGAAVHTIATNGVPFRVLLDDHVLHERAGVTTRGGCVHSSPSPTTRTHITSPFTERTQNGTDRQRHPKFWGRL